MRACVVCCCTKLLPAGAQFDIPGTRQFALLAQLFGRVPHLLGRSAHLLCSLPHLLRSEPLLFRSGSSVLSARAPDFSGLSLLDQLAERSPIAVFRSLASILASSAHDPRSQSSLRLCDARPGTRRAQSTSNKMRRKRESGPTLPVSTSRRTPDFPRPALSSR